MCPLLRDSTPLLFHCINNMRKIEREMIQAIIDRKQSWTLANTRVECTAASCQVYLHGHHIASYWFNSMELLISDKGWKTRTTKSRLNALIKFVYGGTASVTQRQFNWFIKLPNQPAKEWFGDLVSLGLGWLSQAGTHHMVCLYLRDSTSPFSQSQTHHV